MKLTNIALSLALMGTMSLGMADDTVASSSSSSDTTTQTQEQSQSSDSTTNSSSIDAEIAQIQAAPAAKRVELMNQFKEKLMQMNQEDRMAAISVMRERMQANGSAAMNKAGEQGTMARSRMQEHTQEMQMQASEHMNQMQQMNQNHAGDQFNSMHDSMNGGSPMASPMGGSHGNFDMKH